MRCFFKYLLLIAFGLIISELRAQQPRAENLTRILFVFDGSQSMYARWESGRKIDVAQRLMTQMLDSLQSLDSDAFEIALRVYGHQKPVPPQDCNDTRLEVPFAPNNFNRIKKKLRSIKPKGTTPIARSLQRAAYDFPQCENCRNIIILITDGVEACDEDPCAASRQLQKQGIILKPFVIGIGLDKEFKQTFSCVGNFYDAADEKTFQNVLGIVISQALDNTTAQVNLLDGNGLPTETNVPITFYNKVSGKVAEQIIHTLNYKGRPDTIYLDPLVRYAMTVHSIPERHLDSINISAGRHNEIGLDLARGTLLPKVRQRGNNDPIQVVVRETGKAPILHVQSINDAVQYIQGDYDLEILTLPRIVLKDIRVDAGKTTTIDIPPPGVVNLQSTAPGYGSILQYQDNEMRWVCDLDPSLARQSISLQPGRYRVVFRVKSSRNSIYTVSKFFSVSSGASTVVKLN